MPAARLAKMPGSSFRAQNAFQKTVRRHFACFQPAQSYPCLQIFREQAHGHHLSAEELHILLLEKGSNVSLATAYRTLKLLSSLGLLRELDFAEGHKHYELKQDTLPHQHIICIGCNVTIEFEDHFLEEAGQKIGARHNFEVIDAQFKIFGLCPACKEAQKKSGQMPSRMQSERERLRAGRRLKDGSSDKA